MIDVLGGTDRRETAIRAVADLRAAGIHAEPGRPITGFCSIALVVRCPVSEQAGVLEHASRLLAGERYEVAFENQAKDSSKDLRFGGCSVAG